VSPSGPTLVLLPVDPREGAVVKPLARQAVRTALCVFDVRRRVRKEALDLGFSRIVAEELTIVASELCSNIVKFAQEGTFVLDAVRANRDVGLVLEASDDGPHFKAFERATRDRSDDHGSIPPEAMFGRKGIGGGLAAVRRLTDGIHLHQREKGKTIVVVRYLRSTR
jgi:anti-sigma regulatory factor (Ser/Thr protein kinase)